MHLIIRSITHTKGHTLFGLFICMPYKGAQTEGRATRRLVRPKKFKSTIGGAAHIDHRILLPYFLNHSGIGPRASLIPHGVGAHMDGYASHIYQMRQSGTDVTLHMGELSTSPC